MEHAAAKTTAGNEHLVKVIYPKYTIKRAEIIGWFLADMLVHQVILKS